MKSWFVLLLDSLAFKKKSFDSSPFWREAPDNCMTAWITINYMRNQEIPLKG
jgi:hypothetical protein